MNNEDERFLKNINNIDVELLKKQRNIVMQMQEYWKFDEAMQVNGLINVIDLIVDYIDPIVESKELNNE